MGPTTAGTEHKPLSPGRRLAAVGLILLMGAGSIFLWLGIPVGWIYLASRLVDSSQPQMGPYLLVLVGVPVSMFAMGKGLAVLNRAYGELTGTASEVRVRTKWLKSMRGERDDPRPRSVLDVVMVVSVSLALAVFGLWFFLFAGSSLPGT